MTNKKSQLYNRPFETEMFSNRRFLKYFWLIAEILGSIVAATFFFLITTWLVNYDYTIFLYKHQSVPQPIEVRSPSIVWYTPDVGVPLNKKITCFNGSAQLQCDIYIRQSQPDNPQAYLFYAPFLETFPLPRDPKVIWGFLHDESPINNVVYMHEKALNLFNFSATFSRYSNVPFPLIFLRGLDKLTSTRYFVKTPKKNSHLSTLAPVLYLQTNFYTSTNREPYVKELMKYIQVDSYGYSLQNKDLPVYQVYTDPLSDINLYRNYLYDPELLQFLARYKFMVTIENGVCNDYISEKLWRALELGVVPIYFGAPQIRDWLPNNKSAILLEDYPTPELLSQYLHYLLQNDSAYEEYLEHKITGQISNQRLVDELASRPYQNNLKSVIQKFECFTCEKLHDTKSTDINIMTKKQYDCPPARSALSPFTNSDDMYWYVITQEATAMIDDVYEEIRNPNRTQRCSNTNWRQRALKLIGFGNGHK